MRSNNTSRNSWFS